PEIRVEAPVGKGLVAVDGNGVVPSAHISDLALVVLLVVVDQLEPQAVVEEGLRNRGVKRSPALPLALIRAVEEFVIEVEDRRVQEDLVRVICTADDGWVVGGIHEVW